jgi:hypothetical protein
MSNRIALVWAACLLAGAIGVPAAAQSNASIQRGAPQDIAAVHRVMDAYHRALLDHDGAALTALFVPEGGAWLNVMSDAAYAEALAKSPQAQKVRVGSYRDFAAFVSTTKSKLQPTQSNLTIQTDGTIAAAYFEFVFVTDGKPTNRGAETWQLVKGANGWRIAALTYSSTPAGARPEVARRSSP